MRDYRQPSRHNQPTSGTTTCALVSSWRDGCSSRFWSLRRCLKFLRSPRLKSSAAPKITTLQALKLAPLSIGCAELPGRRPTTFRSSTGTETGPRSPRQSLRSSVVAKWRYVVSLAMATFTPHDGVSMVTNGQRNK